MLLAIDIGNTNTVFAIFDGEAQVQDGRFETGGALADHLPSEGISGVIVSSVVPNADAAVKQFCQDALNLEPLFVTKDTISIDIDVIAPEEVGADRLVNAVAVVAHYKSPAIVIDFGTATTFDVIDAQGRYAGGVIAPGINLSIKALHEAAAQLPSIEVEAPTQAIGKNTVQAMQSGIYWGYIGLIEGLVERIKTELGEELFVLATGGLAPLFAGNTHVIETVDQDLTLKGLYQIYKAQA